MRKLLTGLILIASVFSLSACYQGVDVSLHKPGVYKGKSDELLAKLKTPDWNNKLQERFKLSQTDR
jgi:hypothetical protein